MTKRAEQKSSVECNSGNREIKTDNEGQQKKREKGVPRERENKHSGMMH
jgi:hypothetical protein